MTSQNKSPLRYPGGKTRACKILDDIINQYFKISEYDTLVSPFFGGGSFEFYFQNKYNKKIVANDKFTPLYNFWLQVKTDKTILCEELSKIKTVSKDEFLNYRKTILNLNDNTLQQAIQYFIINRCSFSGATLSGGFSEEASKKRFTKSSIERILNLNFENIKILNLNFEVCIENLNPIEKNLIFLDPPYYLEANSKLYGTNGDLHENFNHQNLHDIIVKSSHWILTYNDCEYIRKLYSKYIIIEVDWKYGMNTSKKSSEIVIISQLITVNHNQII